MAHTLTNHPQGGHIETFEDKIPEIADDVFVAATASIIGDVTIGSGSSIWLSLIHI